MAIENTTPIPNAVLDILLPDLTLAELKVLLVILRQTNGWLNHTTGQRKVRDRISHGQFIEKTGLSKRAITDALTSLVVKKYIRVTDCSGNLISESIQRKGRMYLYYAYIGTASTTKTQKLSPSRRYQRATTSEPKRLGACCSLPSFIT